MTAAPTGRGAAALERVNERVYSAMNYGFCNVLYVITDHSVVVIDTTESMAGAQASLEAFRGTCALPVRYIIYTHYHGDHVRGAKALHGPSTQVIAHRKMPELRAASLDERLLPYRRRAVSMQFGFQLPAHRRTLPLARGTDSGYVEPDILFDEEYRFQEGDLRFELYHTEGETVDHVMIWVPELRTLFPGDLYYGNFPMLSNPMRADRPVLRWAESLERMRELRPAHLVPSHGKPLSGAKVIDRVLRNYARAIRYVHDETVKGINAGLSLDEIRAEVALPDDLARLPYLQERYGTVAWAVAGVHRQYTGWYSLQPVDLNPGRRVALHRLLVEAAGGPEPLLARARQALRDDQDQLALELIDVVLGARPRNGPARVLELVTLERLASTSRNAVARNVYRTAAMNLRRGSGRPVWPRRTASRRSAYAGAWGRPASLISEGESAPPRSVVSTASHGDGNGSNGTASQELERSAADAVNRWYDRGMYQSYALQRYGRSGFANFGYWRPGMRSQTDACEELMEMLLAFIPHKVGTILDVACGKGGTTRYLLKYYEPSAVTGINISRKQLRTCGSLAPECKFLEMSATNMTFPDSSFGNVICVEAAHHFHTRERFVGEAHRVLAPGGRLVLSDFPWTTSTPWSVSSPKRAIEPSAYRNMFLSAGFEHVEIIDATEECIDGFYRHSLRVLRERVRRGVIDAHRFRQRRAHIVQNRLGRGYYLLVAAQKPES